MSEIDVLERSSVRDPLHLLEDDHYVPLDAAVWNSLQDGSRTIR